MKKTKYLLMFLLLVAGLTLVGCNKTTAKVTTKAPTTSQTTASKTTASKTTAPTVAPTTAPTTAPITVDEELAAAEKAANAAIAGIVNSDSITGDFQVVAENTKAGVTFAWTSSNTEVASISQTATDKFYTVTVKQPEGTGDVRLTLTVVATCGTKSVTKDITITVKEKVLGTKYDTIAQLYASAKLKDVVIITGTVSSLFKNGYFIYDGQNYLGIYVNADLDASIQVGKEVTITGAYANYNTLYQVSDIINTVVVGDSSIVLPKAQPITTEGIKAIQGNKADHGIPYVVTATIRSVVEGSNTNYDLFDGSEKIGRVYYNSLVASYDVIKALDGKTVTLELTFYTIHSSNGKLFTFYGTAEDVKEVELTDAEKLANEKAALTLVSELESEKTLALPATVANGVTVTWALKEGSLGAISEGVYSAPKVALGADNVDVVLVATLKLGELEDTKEITVKVTPTKVFEVKTIAEMNALPTNDKEYFQVTGIVKAYSGTEESAKKYGNLILQDPLNPEVTIILYGLGLVDNVKEQNVLATKGINIGDMITVIGYRGDYKGTPEIMGGWYVEHFAVKNVSDVENLPAGDTYYAFYVTLSDYYQNADQSKIDNSIKYGNYVAADLNDAAKTCTLYGILIAKGATNGQASSLNLKLNDKVVLIAQISEYKGVKQIANAYYVAHMTPEVVNPDAEAVKADKEALSLPANGRFEDQIDLLAAGEKGSTITWALKDGSKGSIAEGKLVLPAEAVTVTVVATIVKGEVSETVEFEVSVFGEKITVSAARALELGALVAVEGVVSVKNADGFFIQDNDGTTIFVFNKNNTAVVGNKVEVLGTLAKYTANGNDLLQLNPSFVVANDNGTNAVVEDETITTIEAAVAAYPASAGHIITLSNVVVSADTFGYLYLGAVSEGIDLKFKSSTVSETFATECPAGSTIGTIKLAMYNINYSDIVIVVIEVKDIVKPTVEQPDLETITIAFPKNSTSYAETAAVEYNESGIILTYLGGNISAPSSYTDSYAMLLRCKTNVKSTITLNAKNLKEISFDWFVWFASKKDPITNATVLKVEVFEGETLVKSVDFLEAAKNSTLGQVVNQNVILDTAGDYKVVWTMEMKAAASTQNRFCIDNITLKIEK